MFATILGWFWIVMGIFFLWKPEILKKKLNRKSLRKIRKYLFVLAVILGILLIKAGWGYEGALAKIIVILGILAIFKGFFLLKSEITGRMMEWWGQKPLIFFRFGACVYIIIGIMILHLGR